MVPLLEDVLKEVLKRVTPSREERTRIHALAERLRDRVEKAARELGISAEIRVEGSVAKDTWLSGEPDIDIFMSVPTTMPRKAFGTICLNAAKKATRGSKQIERFAEHPYLECVIDRVRVNIVPCYKVKRGEWMSATDRTPFHTDYVKPLLDSQTAGEIRLLKKFMAGIGVYGAEIRVGGFSGYLCELLVLRYGSFTEVLRSVANWLRKEVIDYRSYYKGREGEAKKIFEEPLIVVDPIDKRRNVASAVREERLNTFIAAARVFLRSPDVRFFYPQEVKTLNAEKLVEAMEIRGSALVLVRFGRVEAVPDVLWGQLYKSQRSLRKMLRWFDFRLLRDGVWSNGADVNMFIFEVESRTLPPMKRHLGPPLEKREECERFLEKHLGAEGTLSGPRVEGSRWVVETRRKYTNVTELLAEKLKDGGRRVGVADLLSKAIAGSLEILVNEEILGLYSSNAEFASFLTEYLKGKPRWLK